MGRNHTNRLKMQNGLILVPWGPSIISIITSVPTSVPVSVIASASLAIVVFPPIRNEPIPRPCVPWLGSSYSDPSSSDQLPVRLLAGFLSIISAPVDDEGIEGRVAGQPYLLQGAKLHENSFQVPFSTLLGQICDMKPVSFFIVFRRPEPSPSSGPTP